MKYLYLLFKFSILDILNKTLNGKQILRYYEEKKILNPKYRKLLANTITEYLLSKNYSPGPKTFEKIADKIVEHFSTEVKVGDVLKINSSFIRMFCFRKFIISITKVKNLEAVYILNTIAQFLNFA